MVGLFRLNSVKYVGEGCRGAIQERLWMEEEEEGKAGRGKYHHWLQWICVSSAHLFFPDTDVFLQRYLN